MPPFPSLIMKIRVIIKLIKINKVNKGKQMTDVGFVSRDMMHYRSDHHHHLFTTLGSVTYQIAPDSSGIHPETRSKG